MSQKQLLMLTTTTRVWQAENMPKTVNKSGKRNERPRRALSFTIGGIIMTFGYARCSTNEDKQDINRQIRELKAAGADEIIFEYEHGDSKVKKQQTMMLEQARAGNRWRPAQWHSP